MQPQNGVFNELNRSEVHGLVLLIRVLSEFVPTANQLHLFFLMDLFGGQELFIIVQFGDLSVVFLGLFDEIFRKAPIRRLHHKPAHDERNDDRYLQEQLEITPIRDVHWDTAQVNQSNSEITGPEAGDKVSESDGSVLNHQGVCDGLHSLDKEPLPDSQGHENKNIRSEVNGESKEDLENNTDDNALLSAQLVAQRSTDQRSERHSNEVAGAGQRCQKPPPTYQSKFCDNRLRIVGIKDTIRSIRSKAVCVQITDERAIG